MGPRFNGVEDRTGGTRRAVRAARLQWGHALMAWKTPAQSGESLPLRTASMGPRFNGVEDQIIRLARSSSPGSFNGATL